MTCTLSVLRVIKIIDQASIKIIDGRFHGRTSTGGLFAVCSGFGAPPPLCRHLTCITISTQRRS